MLQRMRQWPTLATVSLALAACYSVVWLALWVAIPAVGLDWTPHTITSGSMEPALRVGDVVVTSPHDGLGLDTGTVITYEDPVADGALTTHRIVDVTEDGDYRTKGDANEHPDSTPVPPENVRSVGRIVVPAIGLPLVWTQQGNTLALALLGLGLLAAFGYATSFDGGDEAEEDPSEGDPSEEGSNDGRPASGGGGLTRRLPGLLSPSPGPAVPGRPRHATSDTGSEGVLTHHGALLARVSAVGAITVLLAGGVLATTGAPVSRATFSGVAANTGNSVQAGFWALLVTGGAEHSCGMRFDGSVWCWGRNDKGQLGDGTTTDSASPTQVLDVDGSGTLESVSRLESGAQAGHTCAVLADRTAACWGVNGSGQLGDGTTTDRTHPVQVEDALGIPLTDVSRVAPGMEHTCMLRTDGTVWCVGRNDKGQLGNGTTDDSAVVTPVLDVGGLTELSGVVAIASGEKHTCAVKDDTTVVCWGQGDKGQLGNAATSDSSLPVQVTDGSGRTFTGAASITAGKKHACVATTDTALWCWGENNEGQLGDGTTSDSETPVRVTGLTDIVDLGIGATHGCAVEGDGTTWCWGVNTSGQLGDTTTDGSTTPVTVASGADGIVGVTGGATHSCARKDDDTVWCWGRNDKSQLGDGTTTDSPVPVEFDDAGGTPLTGVADIAPGKEHTCALRDDGTVWCVGRNDKGQLGDGTGDDSTTLVQVADVGGAGTLSGAVAIAAGEKHTCAVLDDSTVVCWGQGDKGQLGDGTGDDATAPVQVDDGTGTAFDGADSIGAGKKFTCAATASAGEVWCWGENNEGQLGDRSGDDSTVPVQVVDSGGSPFTGAVQLAGGEKHTCARTDTAGMWCWGDNDSGQLGDGTTTDAPSPVQVSGVGGVVDIGVGKDHGCAADTDTRGWCWGTNGSGQLGDGTTTGSSTPVRVME